MLAGSRSILVIAPAATLIGTVLGTALGLVTGYFRGIVDDGVSRLVDAVLALPLIVTAILIVTAVGSTSRWVVTLTIGLIFTPIISRTVRAAVLAETELDYVQAARLRGERAPLHHVLRDPSERVPARGRRVHGAARVRDLRGGVADLHRVRRPAAVARLGGADQPVLDADRSRTGG